MAPFKRILCQTDFSDASRHATEHAIVLARWYKASITALNVLDNPMIMPAPGLPPLQDPVLVAELKRLQLENTIFSLTDPWTTEM